MKAGEHSIKNATFNAINHLLTNRVCKNKLNIAG